MEIQDIDVMLWEEDVEIPTYPAGAPDKNPMFLEKRVYQGSSGKVYPHPVIDKIYDEKKIVKYKAVFLENKYLKIMILPELGGRIQRALDKTNQYDFIYYNRVIKPALVGLAGPWISGGIEFNWPQHHRPNTFGPVEYELCENTDGSKTVWVSEIDRMYGTKCTTGFSLYPGKAYLEIEGRLFNRTPQAQTFLWWANPAVSVNDNTQSIFPPDVYAVYDHGKRDVSRFPIATGTYYKVDYSAGVDISRYKNIPVPTSYMAYHSDYDFIGGYDYGRQAGILHIASHHISPGKKQWTWGCGDFGKAWDRNLTDEDGPYIELMTGVFTENQPDFTWMQPYEEKTFKQYFMPYKGIGVVKNAGLGAAVSLDIDGGNACIGVYATSVQKNAMIRFEGRKSVYLDIQADLLPEAAYQTEVRLLPDEKEWGIKLSVYSADGRMLVSYRPREMAIDSVPEPANAIPAPQENKNNEALYLAGKHLEQYRHATCEPADYYIEGLKRDSGDIRINNAYGALLLSRGRFKESEKHFRNAIESSIRHNSNPIDGEPFYNLGLSLLYQNRVDEAYDAFYKSAWSNAWQDCGYFSIALIDCLRGDYGLALDHIENSLVKNIHNRRARNLKSAVLRKFGRYAEAIGFANETLNIDKLDFGALNELYLSGNDTAALAQLKIIMRGDVHNYISLASDYGAAGHFDEAIEVLERYLGICGGAAKAYPMALYYLGFYCGKNNNAKKAEEYYMLAAKAGTDYCFPNKLDDILVLESSIVFNPSDARAYYYLGCLWYDKKQYNDAIIKWEKAAELDPTFPTAYRNLSLAYFNKAQDFNKARKCLEKAFELNNNDARVFLELDQMYKKLNVPVSDRLAMFDQHMELVELRDDLYIEYVTLLNMQGDYSRAKELLAARKFHPWEGGEGKASKQYIVSRIGIARRFIRAGQYKEAVLELTDALLYPENLGEGKLAGAQDNDINYYLGCAYEGIGDVNTAAEYFRLASKGLDDPSGAMFYNDQPPEMIFYQGLALQKLGDLHAKGRFERLIDYGEKHFSDEPKIDYFAVSLPDFLIFDEDLKKRNEAHCHYLIALGSLGLGNTGAAKSEFMKTLSLDTSHQGAVIHLESAETDEGELHAKRYDQK